MIGDAEIRCWFVWWLEPCILIVDDSKFENMITCRIWTDITFEVITLTLASCFHVRTLMQFKLIYAMHCPCRTPAAELTSSCPRRAHQKQQICLFCSLPLTFQKDDVVRSVSFFCNLWFVVSKNRRCSNQCFSDRLLGPVVPDIFAQTPINFTHDSIFDLSTCILWHMLFGFHGTYHLYLYTFPSSVSSPLVLIDDPVAPCFFCLRQGRLPEKCEFPKALGLFCWVNGESQGWSQVYKDGA